MRVYVFVCARVKHSIWLMDVYDCRDSPSHNLNHFIAYINICIDLHI